jgi:hypothetical membrane protein
MIERNIGNAERIVRFSFGLLFAAWALSQPAIDTFAESLVIIVAASLMLNGIFSRCYLWYLLDVDTTTKRDRCTPSNSIG